MKERGRTRLTLTLIQSQLPFSMIPIRIREGSLGQHPWRNVGEHIGRNRHNNAKYWKEWWLHGFSPHYGREADVNKVNGLMLVAPSARVVSQSSRRHVGNRLHLGTDRWKQGLRGKIVSISKALIRFRILPLTLCRRSMGIAYQSK